MEITQAVHTAQPITSSARRWIGRVLSGLAVAFLTWDGIVKLIKIDAVTEAMNRLGYPDIARSLGTLELVLLALYVFPRTQRLGVLLLTGFLGGAIATHVRVGDPLASHVLFPIYVASMFWGGLYLRDERVRTFVA